MISKKTYSGDGTTTRFLSDFIIRSEQFARPYVFIYDNTLNPDGTEDKLVDGTTDQANWSWPDNIWKRGVDVAQSNDLVVVDKWQVIDNSIAYYIAPITSTTVWLEVATTAEEFGDTLTQPSVERAEAAADEAAASAAAASVSADNAAASEAAIDPTTLLHTVGDGGGNPEGYTSTEIDTNIYTKTGTDALISGLSVTNRVELLTKTGKTVGDIIYQEDIDLIYTWSEDVLVDNGGTILADNGANGFWVHEVLGAVNVKWFDAKGDGVTDDTIALNKAFLFSNVEFEEKTYDFAGQLNITNDCNIIGNGAILNGTTSSAFMNASGSIETEIAVTIALSKGDTLITCVNTFNKDDIIIIRDDTVNSFSNHRTSYKKGEFLEVESATGTTATIRGALKYDYASVTNLKVSRLLPIKVSLGDLTIKNDDASDHVCRIKYARDVFVNRSNFEGGLGRALLLSMCYNSEIANTTCYHQTSTLIGTNYGISIGNCHNVTICNSNMHGARHGVAIGGGDENGAVPNYNVTINNKTKVTNDPSSGIYAADIHGNSINTLYEDCDILGGFSLAGENSSYLNNRIILTTDRILADLAEIVSGIHTIKGNKLSTLGNTAGTFNRIIGTSSNALTDDINEEYSLDIQFNEFEIHSTIAIVCQIWTSATSNVPCNLTFKNNTYKGDCSGLIDIVKYYNNSSVVPKYIHIKDIPQHSTMPVAVKIFTKGSGLDVYTGTKLSLPDYTRYDELVVTTADYRKGVFKTYGFDYGSVIPMGEATISNNNFIGTRLWYTYISASVTGINIFVTSGDVTVLSQAGVTYNVHTKVFADTLIMQ